MPVSAVAYELLIADAGRIHYRRCATYVQAVQDTQWFASAFAAHATRITVAGGRGHSHADAVENRIKIGANDRRAVGKCEHACLHELAHIVTADFGPDGQPREAARGRSSSKGHHHAWRVNFVFIVRNMLGKQAALRLRSEFNHWGLPTLR